MSRIATLILLALGMIHLSDVEGGCVNSTKQSTEETNCEENREETNDEEDREETNAVENREKIIAKENREETIDEEHQGKINAEKNREETNTENNREETNTEKNRGEISDEENRKESNTEDQSENHNVHDSSGTGDISEEDDEDDDFLDSSSDDVQNFVPIDRVNQLMLRKFQRNEKIFYKSWKDTHFAPWPEAFSMKNDDKFSLCVRFIEAKHSRMKVIIPENVPEVISTDIPVTFAKDMFVSEGVKDANPTINTQVILCPEVESSPLFFEEEGDFYLGKWIRDWPNCFVEIVPFENNNSNQLVEGSPENEIYRVQKKYCFRKNIRIPIILK